MQVSAEALEDQKRVSDSSRAVLTGGYEPHIMSDWESNSGPLGTQYIDPSLQLSNGLHFISQPTPGLFMCLLPCAGLLRGGVVSLGLAQGGV